MSTHKYTALQIQAFNTDASGFYKKEDIEAEIQNLYGRTPKSDTEWIEWVIDHALDSNVQSSIIDTFIKSEVVEIAFWVGSDFYRLRKIGC